MRSDDDSRLQARSSELRRRWVARHPEAAEEMRRGFHTREQIDAWAARYPQAAAEDVRVALFGPNLIRSRRMSEPGWEPPERWAAGL